MFTWLVNIFTFLSSRHVKPSNTRPGILLVLHLSFELDSFELDSFELDSFELDSFELDSVHLYIPLK